MQSKLSRDMPPERRDVGLNSAATRLPIFRESNVSGKFLKDAFHKKS